jgi:hypothetical protein
VYEHRGERNVVLFAPKASPQPATRARKQKQKWSERLEKPQQATALGRDVHWLRISAGTLARPASSRDCRISFRSASFEADAAEACSSPWGMAARRNAKRWKGR